MFSNLISIISNDQIPNKYNYSDFLYLSFLSWQVNNPATGQVIADVACMGTKEANVAIASAYEAFQSMDF